MNTLCSNTTPFWPILVLAELTYRASPRRGFRILMCNFPQLAHMGIL